MIDAKYPLQKHAEWLMMCEFEALGFKRASQYYSWTRAIRLRNLPVGLAAHKLPSNGNLKFAVYDEPRVILLHSPLNCSTLNKLSKGN